MEVILLERIEKLGQMGDIVKVKPGFARNYLLPQAKAFRSNKENLELFETRKVQLEAANLKRKEEAEQIAAKMEGLNLVIIRQAAETGQLYGSVTGRDVRDAIREAGYTIERRQVVLDQPLKEIGSFSVRIVLHPDVSRMVNVMVARSAEEAERNAKAAATAAAKAAAEVAVVEEAAAAEA
ncbi:MAG: 50S ribosomal protein L9 [Alphaproteobacteria bacterium]|nr:50S ribosomal protein L9 [Alphaproteobacteria bacterium]